MVSTLFQTGEELLSQASADGLTLRLIGSLAVVVRCERAAELTGLLEREPPADLDFAGLRAEANGLSDLFLADGWHVDPTVAAGQEYGLGRLIFHRGLTKADVFLDELRMSHVIPLRERFAGDALTVPLAELLLSKLQVVELTRKDIVDAVMLLAEHPVGDADGEQINGGVIAGLLRSDWGFERTVRTNLEVLLASRELRLLDPADAEAVRTRVKQLLGRVDAAPRTVGWKLRAKVGTRARWYEEVGDVDR